MLSGPFWDYWWFHLPNYLLSAVAWTLFGRFLLGFLVPADSSNYIWRAFCRLTQPFVFGVRQLTPAIIPLPFVVLLAFAWVYVIRTAALLLLLYYGVLPSIEGAS